MKISRRIKNIFWKIVAILMLLCTVDEIYDVWTGNVHKAFITLILVLWGLWLAADFWDAYLTVKCPMCGHKQLMSHHELDLSRKYDGPFCGKCGMKIWRN